MIYRGAGLLIVKDGRILMVERRKEKTFKIGIPGGKAEPFEYDIETAIRETYEETGLVCHIPTPNRYFVHTDEKGFSFVTFRGLIVAGRLFTKDNLRQTSEGQPFWLDLSCFKKLPSVLQYPEWSSQAIKFFRL